MNLNNYFFGTEIIKQYKRQRDTLDDLCAEIRSLKHPSLDLLNFHSERHNKKFKSIFYEFCEVTLSKFLPDFFSLSALSYGILTREWFNCSVGISISEGARVLIGACFYDNRINLERKLENMKIKININKHETLERKTDCDLEDYCVLTNIHSDFEDDTSGFEEQYYLEDDDIPTLEEDNDDCGFDKSGYDGWLNSKECDD